MEPAACFNPAQLDSFDCKMKKSQVSDKTYLEGSFSLNCFKKKH